MYRVTVIGVWYTHGDRKPNFIAKFIATAILILIFTSLVACSIVKSGDCANPNEFAYIGIDGNVYRYDLCNRQSVPITTDAQLNLSGDVVLSGKYSLADEAWSPNGNYILAKFRGLGSSVFLINANDGSKFSFGDLEYSNWSPTGDYLVLVRSGLIGYEGYDENIYVFDMDLAKEIYHDSGRAPYWFNDRSLFFLQAKRLTTSNNKIQELWRQDFTDAGSGNSTPLSLRVESANPIHSYANQISLSPDKKWAAIFVPGIFEMSEIRIFNFETNQFMTEGTLPLPDGTSVTRKWTTESDFEWSPTHSILAFCNGGGGADDSYNFLYGGALFLINEGELVAITESKCGRTQISWSPLGDTVAYLNSIGGISIVDLAGRLLVSSSDIQIKDSENLKVQAGPWWSYDGTLISLVADNKICLAPVDKNISQLEFECIVDGSMMAWKP